MNFMCDAGVLRGATLEVIIKQKKKKHIYIYTYIKMVRRNIDIYHPTDPIHGWRNHNRNADSLLTEREVFI